MTARRQQLGLRLIERPREVEASLWRQLRFEGNHACREVIFNLHRPFAKIIAMHEYSRRPAYGLQRDDFEQLAYGGLLEAIDRFDPLHGAPFEAYARRRVRGAIADGITLSSESAAQYDYVRRIEKERLKSLNPADHHNPDDFITRLGELVALLAIGFIASGVVSSPEQAELADVDLDAYGTIGWRDLQFNIMREIERLTPSERTVLQQHYFNGVEFQHIAKLLGVTKGRTSQLHRSALLKIRARLQAHD
jgi:RNA polymerase sigma factor for flagellar operon FliA